MLPGFQTRLGSWFSGPCSLLSIVCQDTHHGSESPFGPHACLRVQDHDESEDHQVSLPVKPIQTKGVEFQVSYGPAVHLWSELD